MYFYVSTLVPVFRLFPHEQVMLCDAEGHCSIAHSEKHEALITRLDESLRRPDQIRTQPEGRPMVIEFIKNMLRLYNVILRCPLISSIKVHSA